MTATEAMTETAAGPLRLGALALALSLAALTALPTSARAEQPAEPAAERASAKTAASVQTRATLYAFFATWCVPCRVELPHIQRFHESYAERGLKVVLVSEDAPSSAQKIPAFLARFGVTAPWILDDESELIERYNPSASLPFTVLLDATGKVAYAHSGYEPGDEELLESKILAVLGPPAPSASGPAPGQAPGRADIAQPGAAADATAAGNAGELSADGAAADRPPVRVTASMQSLGAFLTARYGAISTEDDLGGLAGRVEVAGDAGDYRASVRVDGSAFPIDDEDYSDRNAARLERVAVTGQLGAVSLLAGDDYVSFGNGLALSLRKIDPLGVDTSLQGGRADVDIGRVSVTALAGLTNPQNFDPINWEPVTGDDAPRDLIAGSEVAIAIGERGEIAPYLLYARANEAGPGDEDISWMTAGTSTRLSLGPIGIAAEVAGGMRDSSASDGSGMAGIDSSETIWAAYTSVQWTAGKFTTLVDAKAYRHWAIGRDDLSLLYHEPPTLERVDQEVPGNEDAAGARARVEWRVLDNATVFGNLLGYRYSEDRTSPFDGDLAMHGYIGGEFRPGQDGDASLGLELGYRRENDTDGNEKITLWQVDVDGAWRLPGRLALTGKWNHRSETKVAFRDIDFIRGLAVLGLSRTGLGTISVLYGYSTEISTTPTHYPGGEVLFHLPRGGNIRFFVGRIAGGRVCVSGTCRDVPGFSGARLDLNIQI